MTITKDDAQMLATLACRSRPVGARQWNPDAVMAEIAKLHDRSLPVVALAVLRAAADRHAERPEVISSAGSHWGDTMLATEPTPRLKPTERCSICSASEPACRIHHGGHCANCETGACDHHEFISAVDAARAAQGTPDALHGVIAALRDELKSAPERGPAPARGLEALAERDPVLRARVDAVRAALPSAPMREDVAAAVSEVVGA